MYHKLSGGFVALFVLFLSGCSTVESRIQSNPQVYGLLSPADQALVRQGRIREGLPKAAVYLAWGSPDRIRSGVRLGHTFEAWTYTTLRSEFRSIPILTLFHMRYPTRPRFSKEVFALDGSTCAIEKGLLPADISLT